MTTPPIQRASRVAPTTDPYTQPRMPVVIQRYDQGVRQRAYLHEGPPPKRSLLRLLGRMHPLVYVVLTLLVIGGANWLVGWWNTEEQYRKYGYPPTSHLDAVVGHNDSATNETHFIFLNLHGHIEIIEIPGGDASHARLFTGPTLIGDRQDLTPVTGEIRRENGRLDLIVHIQDQQITYINDGDTFHQQ